MREGLRRQRGVALLTVLLIGALAIVVAVSMISRAQLAIAKTRQVVYQDQALAYALGVEHWFRGLLRDDALDDEASPPVDGVGDRWWAPSVFEIEQGRLEVRVRDLSGRLNLNAVDDPAGRDRFRRLLATLGLDAALADALADWIDDDLEVSGVGAEDGTYLVAEPPHRAANRPMATVGELRLLPEVDAAVFARLLPHVAALPPGIRRVNVNTATPAVLAALAPGMDAQRAAGYALPETPWRQAGELIGQEAGFAPEAGVLTTTSRYFELLVRAEYAGRTVTLRSIVHRDPETGRTEVVRRDLSRRFATWATVPEPGDDDGPAGLLTEDG
jgi:general secretion pathway protein K